MEISKRIIMGAKRALGDILKKRNRKRKTFLRIL
jgi:hypothetical protein